jgi:aldehyde dehydrogenase (NAD+)
MLADIYPDAAYVHPAIVEMPAQTRIVCEETFAPILYVLPPDTLDEAIALQNGVPQAGIVDLHDGRARSGDVPPQLVPIAVSLTSTSDRPASEIGGAFGGEKDTGGGRESSSDAWRATCAARPAPQLLASAAAGARHQVRHLKHRAAMGGRLS